VKTADDTGIKTVHHTQAKPLVCLLCSGLSRPVRKRSSFSTEKAT